MSPAFARYYSVRELLPHHHHVLVQFEGADPVVSVGMFARAGNPSELLFGHVTYQQKDDDAFVERMHAALDVMRSGDDLGLYYVSANERLSATPQGQVYVDASGDLFR